MLLDRLVQYLKEAESPQLSYIRDDSRMEIWIKGKEGIPILISEINKQRYIISWDGVAYEVNDKEKAYQYVVRICWSIGENK